MKTIKFYQKNCVPCNMLADMMEELDLEVDESVEVTPNNINFIKQEYDIQSTPTVIKLNEDGQEVDRLSGIGMSKVKKFFNS